MPWKVRRLSTQRKASLNTRRAANVFLNWYYPRHQEAMATLPRRPRARICLHGHVGFAHCKRRKNVRNDGSRFDSAFQIEVWMPEFTAWRRNEVRRATAFRLLRAHWVTVNICKWMLAPLRCKRKLEARPCLSPEFPHRCLPKLARPSKLETQGSTNTYIDLYMLYNIDYRSNVMLET